MAMPANEIEALIKAALPDATVKIDDLAGDGDHYERGPYRRRLNPRIKVPAKKCHCRP